MLKYYRVIWYKEPSEERVGVIETYENNAISKSTPNKLATARKFQPNTHSYAYLTIFVPIFLATVKNLEEQKTYKVQIFALSTNDYESFSQKYIYYVPSFPMKKPIFIGAAGGALLVAIIIAALWYIFNLSGKKLIS